MNGSTTVAEDRPADSLSEVRPTAKSRIFAVEDSPTQARKLRFTLMGNGFEVQAVHSGEDALKQLVEFIPDIIISDTVLPGIDGYELCRHVKQMETLRDVPFILLTSLEHSDDVLMGLQCGADQFLTKPWNEEFLISRIHFILKTREVRRTHPDTGKNSYITFGGKEFSIDADREQVLDLLISTYENAVQKARELRDANERLQDAMQTINTMKELVPICSCCQKIRNDSGYWSKVDEFLTNHNVAQFSQSYCPDCAHKVLEDAGMDSDGLEG